MRKSRSPTFVFTVESTEDARLRGVKAAVRQMNKRGAGLRVMLSPRAGRDSPHAWKRKNRFKPRLRIEDAQSIDVYVADKSPGDRTKSRPAPPRR